MRDVTTPPSSLARWSRRLAVFSVQLAIVAILLHRFLSLPSPVALTIVLAAFAGAALAVLMALASLIGIWRDGREGALSAGAGMLLGLALLAWPASVVPLYRSLPAIYDITTDPAAPPSFVALAARRTGPLNGPAYGGRAVSGQQLQAYPDIRPEIVPRGVADTWEAVGEAVRRLQWRVVSETPPKPGQPGYIEAVDRTLVLGFYDDVVVRVEGDASETRVDVRSASRFGKHDFGRNAKRIRDLFAELKGRLEESASGVERPRRGRPGQAVPRRGQDAPGAQPDRKRAPNRARPGSRREPQQTATPPARVSDRDRDRSQRRSQQ
jgi:uncharacterized protein (DUF1499 family)